MRSKVTQAQVYYTFSVTTCVKAVHQKTAFNPLAKCSHKTQALTVLYLYYVVLNH
jgi:hypothetical protein